MPAPRMPASDPAPLDEASADAAPLPLFTRWYGEAEAAALPDYNAVALATATEDGAPSVRIVLLRGFDERGFVFFTNYRSRKARELAVNARAALVFYWPQLKRQIRIEGLVELVGSAESDAYFRSRPRGHQLNAHASPQSEVVPSRRVLEERMRQLEKQFAGLEHVPRPAHWGGYRVAPLVFEFWQGGEDRLHDRLRYRSEPDGSWTRERLAP
jgi:pyridoxamine 5'-phosphate oxidase